MIYNLGLEQRLLAGLIKYPNCYGDIADIIGEGDFSSDQNKITKTIFSALKGLCENGGGVDEVILIERIKSLGISFPQDIEIGDYIRSLSLQKISEKQFLDVARELKKYTVRREIYKAAADTAKKVKTISSDASYDDIIDLADKTFNKKVDMFGCGEKAFSNIYAEMENHIETLGENPKDEMGLMGPFDVVNNLYGSLLRPGNITVIVARSGVGKTRLAMNYTMKVSQKYNVPVLHFDNGEMSKNELIIRQCCSLSGVSSHLLETGQWRLAGKATVEKVRDIWERIKDLECYYYGVGGHDSEKMVNLLKRFYYSKIGRGKRMIFSFDYIKPTEEAGRSEWQVVGSMVNRFKRAIQEEIKYQGEPVIPMFTSIQSNRSGIVTNKHSKDINDDEGIVSLSDRVTQYCSHLFILRDKTLDQIADENQQFGTHLLINLKSRHLGKWYKRATSPVDMGGGKFVPNKIHLDMEGFDVSCKGDQVDLKDFLNLSPTVKQAIGSGGVPKQLL